MAGDTLIALGKITGVHGLNGNLKIVSYSKDMDSFGMGASVFIRDKNGNNSEFSITSARPHKKGFLVSLKGIDHISTAEAYVGSEILMRRDELPELDEDTNYWVDLIGLEVKDVNGICLGNLTSIIETGSNDVYVIRDESGKEILIPALPWVIKVVDLDSGFMMVEVPEGL